MTESMSNQNSAASPLQYATPAVASTGSRVTAATVIIAAGLGLILLGGCFLIGILIMTTGQFNGIVANPITWSPSTYFLVVVLYVMAFGCFAGAIAVILSGLRGLFRIMQGKN